MVSKGEHFNRNYEATLQNSIVKSLYTSQEPIRPELIFSVSARYEATRSISTVSPLDEMVFHLDSRESHKKMWVIVSFKSYIVISREVGDGRCSVGEQHIKNCMIIIYKHLVNCDNLVCDSFHC